MYDLIVIGSGPGGYIAAERAGHRGKKVLIIEKDELGGVCTNHGCIPTKCLLASAKHYTHALHGENFGVTCSQVEFSLIKAMERKQEVIDQLRKGIGFLMKSNKVEVIMGEAKITNSSTVEVHSDGKNQSYQGQNIIIATGSRPFVPPIPGVDRAVESGFVVTSRQILQRKEIPAKLVVIGGGVIGLEFANFFSQIGSEVTVVEMMDEVAPLMDPEFSKMLRAQLKPVQFKLSCKVEGIEGKQVKFTDKKGKTDYLDADLVLMSVGRRPNIDGLDGIGLDVSPKGVAIDNRMATNLPGVWAIGDVTGKSLLAHSASRMAEVAVDNMFSDSPKAGQIMRYEAIPWAIYSNPEAAGCGLTEKEAAEKGIPVKIGSMPFLANGRFLAEYGKERGMCKVIAHAETDLILGVHMLGGACSEIIHSAAIMIEDELRIQDVKEIIFPHPSMSEIVKDAVWNIK
jgi:dihydrolipoamide dehydrogenase